MKRNTAFVVALVALGLAGCSSSPMSRIDQNRALYESWPVEMQEAVLDARVEKGMTPDRVRMARGEPTRVDTNPSKGADEIWVYQKSSGANLPLPNVSVGGGIGGVGVSSGRRGGRGGGSRSANNADEQVVFQNGVVTRVDN
jgi:hypothetical protein